jgi:hypothetical protein
MTTSFEEMIEIFGSDCNLGAGKSELSTCFMLTVYFLYREAFLWEYHIVDYRHTDPKELVQGNLIFYALGPTPQVYEQRNAFRLALDNGIEGTPVGIEFGIFFLNYSSGFVGGAVTSEWNCSTSKSRSLPQRVNGSGNRIVSASPFPRLEGKP